MADDNYARFRCSCCGQDLMPTQRVPFETECPQCLYLHAMGVYTIQQYNDWLRKP